MSSTSVHSEQEQNIQLVGGQVIPNLKENEMEIPPKSSGKGPTSLEVIFGEGISIPKSKEKGIICIGEKVTIHIDSKEIFGDILKLSKKELAEIFEKYPEYREKIERESLSKHSEGR